MSMEAADGVTRHLLRTALRLGGLGGWTLDVATGRMEVTEEYAGLLGYGREGFVESRGRLLSTVHPVERMGANRFFASVCAGEAPDEVSVRVRTAQGGYRWIRFAAEALARDQAGSPAAVVGIIQDVTAQKRGEDALRGRTALLQALLDRAPIMVLAADPQGKPAFANQCLVDTLGWTLQEIWTLHDPVAAFHPDPGARTVARDADAEGDGRWRVISTRTKEGADRLVSWAHVTLADGTRVAMGRDVTELVSYEEELRAVNQQLERRVEERTAELRAANKELGSFAHSVSHDLKGPLRAIGGLAAILEQDHGASLAGDGRHLLRQLRDQARRMGALIEDILTLCQAARTELRRQVLDSTALVTDIARRETRWDGSPAMVLHIGRLPAVSADPVLFGQIITNLVSNAVKFSRHVSRPALTISADPDGDWVTFHVADNGAGFDPGRAEWMFEPFERLHSVEEFDGTGIGLAIVRQAVERHGGRVWAEGAPGSGATVHFTLPAARENEGASASLERESPSG